MSIENDAAETARETVKLPSNLMEILRQSYDTREKILDWILAFCVVGIALWSFYPTLKQKTAAKHIKPNENVSDALPDVFEQDAPSRLYTYNMPAARPTGRRVGPTATRTPNAPYLMPDYPV